MQRRTQIIVGSLLVSPFVVSISALLLFMVVDLARRPYGWLAFVAWGVLASAWCGAKMLFGGK